MTMQLTLTAVLVLLAWYRLHTARPAAAAEDGPNCHRTFG
jgi:hypothetical protein